MKKNLLFHLNTQIQLCMTSLQLLSRFICVQLCVTPQTAAHQAPPSLGFSRQEHWSGLPFPLQCMKVKSEREVPQSFPTLSDPIDCSPPGSSVHGIFQARVLEWGAIAFSNDKFSYQLLMSHKSGLPGVEAAVLGTSFYERLQCLLIMVSTKINCTLILNLFFFSCWVGKKVAVIHICYIRPWLVICRFSMSMFNLELDFFSLYFRNRDVTLTLLRFFCKNVQMCIKSQIHWYS